MDKGKGVTNFCMIFFLQVISCEHLVNASILGRFCRNLIVC